MKMHNLRDLLAIVEKGSINAAARHLGIAQPALSRSIRALEQEVGAPLLERHSTGAVLTPIGELFAGRVSVAMQELRRAHDEAQQLQGGVHGTVAACVSSLAHIALLSEALQPFYQRYPKVKVRIVEGVYPQIEARLKNGLFDFYVGAAPDDGPAPELKMVKLFDNTRVVLARLGHPLAQAQSLAELAEASWIGTSISHRVDSEVGAVFARLGLAPPHIAFHAESALSWITAVTATDLLVISPVQWLNSPLTRDLMAPIPIRETLAAPAIVMIHRGSVPLTPAAEYLGDMMRRPASRYAQAGV